MDMVLDVGDAVVLKFYALDCISLFLIALILVILCELYLMKPDLDTLLMAFLPITLT